MNLTINLLKDTVSLKDFYCGSKAMDIFIHTDLEQCLRNHYCRLYGVKDVDTGNVVAMLALNFDSLELDDDRYEVMSGISTASKPDFSQEYKEIFEAKPHYPSLEVTYFAVRSDMQRIGIGSVVMEKIAEMAQKQEFAGCQFLTVEALAGRDYSAVSFYERCSFAPCEYINPNKGTLRMFRTLFPNEDSCER